ncbi:hypothetical protein B0H13DRAFT_1890654 [Mycena leptocephala]|nr:hypothetical protein B0H13DRAFT_1890654 [Mycena leptocephala]
MGNHLHFDPFGRGRLLQCHAPWDPREKPRVFPINSRKRKRSFAEFGSHKLLPLRTLLCSSKERSGKRKIKSVRETVSTLVSTSTIGNDLIHSRILNVLILIPSCNCEQLGKLYEKNAGHQDENIESLYSVTAVKRSLSEFGAADSYFD